MRIVHLARPDPKPVKLKKVQDNRRSRCIEMLNRQKIKDRKKAELMFADRLKRVTEKLKKLGL